MYHDVVMRSNTETFPFDLSQSMQSRVAAIESDFGVTVLWSKFGGWKVGTDDASHGSPTLKALRESLEIAKEQFDILSHIGDGEVTA